MGKCASVLILTASLAAGLTGVSMAADGVGDLERTLQAVQTVSGLSAYGRIEACGIKIEQSRFTRFSSEVSPGQTIGPGDGILVVVLTLPAIPGTEATTEGADPYRVAVARWYIRKGKVWPQNGWAQRIQYQPKPLEWMNC